MSPSFSLLSHTEIGWGGAQLEPHASSAIPTGHHFIPSSLDRGHALLGTHDETLRMRQVFFALDDRYMLWPPSSAPGREKNVGGTVSRIALITDRFRFSPRSCQGRERASNEPRRVACWLASNEDRSLALSFFIFYFFYFLFSQFLHSSLLTFVLFPFSP